MKKKYELVEDYNIEFDDKTLYRIKALRDFSDVKRGDLGGYIRKKKTFLMKEIVGYMTMLKYLIMPL